MNATNEYPTDAQIEDEARLYSLDLANGLDWCFDDFNLKCFVRALLTPFSALPIDEDALTAEKAAGMAVLSAAQRSEIAERVHSQCERLKPHATFRSAASQAISDTLAALTPKKVAQAEPVARQEDAFVLVSKDALRKLRASINGDCYMGESWEREAIAAMLAAKNAGAQAGEPMAVPPRWYTVDEIRHTLKLMNYCDDLAIELSTWFVRHLQLAFNKGFEKGQRTTAPQPAQPAQTAALSNEQILAMAVNYRYEEPEASGYDFGAQKLIRFVRDILAAHNGGKHD